MALSPYQKANPHRPTGGRSHATYLERSFQEGRIDEMASWWEAGVVAKTLATPRLAPSLMNAASQGMAQGLLPRDLRLDWMTRLWDAGAGRLAKEHQERWLYCLIALPDVAGFLMDKGVSPHAAMPDRHRDCTSACVHLLDALIRVERGGNQKRPDPDAMAQAWAHLDRAWNTQGWFPSQRSRALDLLTWGANGAGAEQMHRMETLRDGLVGPDANPLKPEGSGAAINRWLCSWDRKGQSDAEDVEPGWRRWGVALFGRPPEARGTTTGDLYFWESVASNPECTALVDALAGWGRLPWHISMAERSNIRERADIPRMTVMSLWGDPLDTARNLSTATLPTWLACLEQVALRHGYPGPEWVEVALGDWARRWNTLGPKDGTACDEEWQAWMAGLKTLSRLGQWPEAGCPRGAAMVLHSIVHSPLMLACQDERLKDVSSVLREAGVLVQSLMPGDMAERGWGGKEERKARERAIWKPSHKWLALKRWCSSTELLDELMTALPREPGRAHDGLVAMGAASEGTPLAGAAPLPARAIFQKVVAACPDWLPARGQLLLQECLAAGNAGAARALVECMATIEDAGLVWQAWSIGATDTPKPKTLTPECPWMELARRLIERGLDPNEGEPSMLPLATVAGHAREDAAAQSIQWLIDHGARPGMAAPREASTAAYRLWACARDEQALSHAIDAEPASPRMRVRL